MESAILTIALGLIPINHGPLAPPAAIVSAECPLQKGMPKADALKCLGEPIAVEKGHDLFDGHPYSQLFFKGPFCLKKDETCYIIIEKGKVTKWSDFKIASEED